MLANIFFCSVKIRYREEEIVLLKCYSFIEVEFEDAATYSRYNGNDIIKLRDIEEYEKTKQNNEVK
jgi:hypothetical protein